MKHHLTLFAIALALGFAGSHSTSKVLAKDAVAARFDQSSPAVAEADQSQPVADDAPSTSDAGPAADASTAADDDPPAVETPADDAEEKEASDSPITAEPGVRIADDGLEVEVIRERFPNGSVKIEREVTQDAEGNYVNHGAWKQWDMQGGIVSEGQYHLGQRTGVWNRWYRSTEVELLKSIPYNQYHGVMISQATFDLGKLNGKWTIYDSHQHKVSEWEFVDGQRNGTFTWWYPNGQKMRQCHFEADEMNGDFVEWSSTNHVTAHAIYQHGRRLGARAEKHKSGGKKSEGTYLFAREVLQTPDDWAAATPATFVKQGKDERHGHWVSWYVNGQKQYEGDYEHDVQVGKFTWWFSNGQRALEGEYVDGEQQGKWVWWFENGQKSIQGEYENGHPMGQWTWWNTDGKVARASEMERGAGEIVQAPAPLPTQAKPSTPPSSRSANRNSNAAGQAKPAVR